MDLEGLSEKRTRKGTVYYETFEGEIVAKTCGKCGEIKPLGDYVKHSKKLGGRASECKECTAKYRSENREYVRELSRKYREEHLESSRERARKWKVDNKERVSESLRKWREDNKDHVVKYREANKEHSSETSRKWRQNNKPQLRLKSQRRRAQKKLLPYDFTQEQIDYLVDYFGGCSLTGDIDDIHWDHVIPIVTGHGGTTDGNMIPLRADLNLSKNDNNIFEWFNANRQRFELSQERFDNLIAWLASANAITVEEYRNHVYWCHANPRTIDELEAQ